ncbi:MAG: hypothetical protein ABIE43_04725 [Patescibacteria group bacterium]
MKSTRLLFLVIILIAVIALAGVLWYLNRPVNNQPEPNNQGQEEQNQEEKQTHPEEVINYLENGEIDISNWSTYRNEVYKFEIKYPLFLRSYKNSTKKSFGFDYKKNTNWNFFLSNTFPTFTDLSLEEKINRFKNDTFKNEIKIDSGYVLYGIEYTKGGYIPGALILGEKEILSAEFYLYDQSPEFTQYDPKYYEVFIKMLETSRFYE